jgi:hypothetical protein
MNESLLRLHALLVRDAITAVAARDDVTDSMLESFAKRRAPLYARPDLAPDGPAYWPGIAAALAPIGPPVWMPMEAVVLGGNTLEGGARGLRGLFTREPSEKERKRVLRIATLAARILHIVASADETMRTDELHLIEMAMNSFGLGPEERGKLRQELQPSFESLEVPPDLDARSRRDLLRGAWQLAFVESLDPAKDVMVRGIAGHLQVSAEYDHVRTEVQAEQKKQSEMAQVAIELARTAAQRLAPEKIRPWLDHVIDAAVPSIRRAELRALANGTTPPTVDTLPRLDSDRRRQAMALASMVLLGHDPSVSIATMLRAELIVAAEKAGVAGNADQAFALIDRWLLGRTAAHAPTLMVAPPVIVAAPGTAAAVNPAVVMASPSGPAFAKAPIAPGVRPSPAVASASAVIGEQADQKPETD